MLQLAFIRHRIIPVVTALNKRFVRFFTRQHQILQFFVIIYCKLSVFNTAPAPLPYLQEWHMDAMLVPRVSAESVEIPASDVDLCHDSMQLDFRAARCFCRGGSST